MKKVCSLLMTLVLLLAFSAAHAESHRVLTVYFSVPEDVSIEGVDAIAGASVVAQDGEALGNLQYAAGLIHETVDGDLTRIETQQQYPLDHDPLVDFAAGEQDADARPELAAIIEDLEQYDTILLGYPIWWGDLPMPLYTFLESCDLSGKIIIPFTVHGGSGFADTRETIARLQPGALVVQDGLSVSRNAVADSAQEIVAWAEGLGVSDTGEPLE